MKKGREERRKEEGRERKENNKIKKFRRRDGELKRAEKRGLKGGGEECEISPWTICSTFSE